MEQVLSRRMNCVECCTRRSSQPAHALALTHGAGSNASAPLLVSLSRAFCEAGLLVLRYDLPFRVARRRGPTSPAVAGARPRRRGSGSAGAAAAREGARVCRRPFLRRQADRDDRGGASGIWPTGCCCSRIRCIRPGSRISRAPRFSRSGAPPRSSSTARATPSARLEELREAIARIPARVDLLAVEGAGHDLKAGGAHGWGDPRPHVILKNKSPRGISMREYRYTTPHGIQVTRSASKTNFRKGLQHLLAIWTSTVGSIFRRDTSIPGDTRAGTSHPPVRRWRSFRTTAAWKSVRSMRAESRLARMFHGLLADHPALGRVRL